MPKECFNCKVIALQLTSLNKNSNVTKFIKTLHEITRLDIANTVRPCWIIKEEKEHSKYVCKIKTSVWFSVCAELYNTIIIIIIFLLIKKDIRSDNYRLRGYDLRA